MITIGFIFLNTLSHGIVDGDISKVFSCNADEIVGGNRSDIETHAIFFNVVCCFIVNAMV